jgi:hypothetical protein
MSDTYLTPSTTTILVDSSDIISGVPRVYLASSINSIGTFFTIRDSTGNCSANKKVVLSTTNGIFFTGGANISSFEIGQPFSFLTVRQKSTTEWSLINTYPLASQTASVVGTLNALQLNVSSLFVDNFISSFLLTADSISTNNLSTGSLFTSSLAINKTTNPVFPLDVNGTGYISSLFTQQIGINTSTPTYSLEIAGGNASFQSTLYLTNGVFRSDPTAPTLDKNDFLFSYSSIIINSSLVIQNPATGYSNVGIRTLTPQYALDVNGTAFFGSTLTNAIGVNTSNPQYNLDVNGIGRITSSIHSYVQVTGTAEINNPYSVSSILIATGCNSGPTGVLLSSASPDGTNWYRQTALTLPSSVNGVAYGNGRWVATGNSGSNVSTLFYSDDLNNWYEANLSFNGYGNKVVWNGSYFLAVGKHSVSTNTILKSFDGASWTSSFNGFGEEGRSLAWNGRMWIAAGDGSGAIVAQETRSLMYSYNGVNWSNCVGNLFDIRANDVTWAGTKWISVGEHSAGFTIAYTDDGIQWQVISSIFATAGYGIHYNGDQIIAVGNGGSAVSSIFVSGTGYTWSNITTGGFSSYGNSVAWNGRFWLATGKGSSTNANIQYSSDGFNWSNSSSGSFTGEGFSVYNNYSIIPSLSLNNLNFFTQNIPVFIYSTNQITTTPSSIKINDVLTIGNPALGQYFVGINNSKPISCLDVQVNKNITGIAGYPICRSIANDSAAKATLQNSGSSNASLWPSPLTNSLNFYWKYGSTYYKFSQPGSSFFTGQHANYCVDSNINTSTVSNYVGLIVSSADQGYISVKGDGTKVTKKDAIFITEALPVIKLSDKDMDKAVFGVISNHANENYTTDGTHDLDDTSIFETNLFGRVRVNGLGEGAIWITSINGNLINGDYICSSAIPGFGRRQDDDILHNYTVAKITMDCDFILDQDEYVCEEFEWNGSTLRKAYVGCTYHCS